MKRKYIKTLVYSSNGSAIVGNDYDLFVNGELAELLDSGYNVIDVKSSYEYNDSMDQFMLCTIFYEDYILVSQKTNSSLKGLVSQKRLTVS